MTHTQGEYVMRAKMRVTSTDKTNAGKEGDPYRSISIRAAAVCKDGGYPADGMDEDNSFARWTPSMELTGTINNPALFDRLAEGNVFYVDFHRAVPVPVTPAPTAS